MTDLSELAWDGPDWWDHAACSKADPDLFTAWRIRENRAPRSQYDRIYGQWAAAKAYCDRCPVLAQCREWALNWEAPAGETKVHDMFAGGLNPAELNKLQARRDDKRRRRSA